MNENAAQIFTLDALCSLTNMSKRTIRYYMQLGLVPRPRGEARGAYYTVDHLERLLRIKKLTEAGVSLERIREVLEGEESPVPPRRRRPGSIEVRSHLFVAPGIEIQFTAEEAGMTVDQARDFVRGVMDVAAQVLGESADTLHNKQSH
jgi:DNA-binding transcriptional MerR regulator